MVPGASNEDAGVVWAYAGLGFHAAQKLKDLFRLLRFMALVVLPDGGICRGINHNCFNCRGTYVQAN